MRVLFNKARSSRAGLTLVELMLAVGLMALLAVAILQLLDTTVTVWRKSETRRSLVEQATVVVDLIADDMRDLAAGERGDLMAEWVSFDTDGDGLPDSYWPRMRLVRQASDQEMAYRQRGSQSTLAGQGLIESVWCLTPFSQEADSRIEGILWHGERIYGDPSSLSYFTPEFFRASPRGQAGALKEVSGGVLWFGMEFASQTTSLADGWTIGPELAQASASWDAYGLERPDSGIHPFNEQSSGIPIGQDEAQLPRRVRITLEFERPRDRKRRTRLSEPMEADAGVMILADPGRVPERGEHYLRVGPEWMKLMTVSGRNVSVQRGQRGTRPIDHPAGEMVHYGSRWVREVPVTLHEQNWNLR